VWLSSASFYEMLWVFSDLEIDSISAVVAELNYSSQGDGLRAVGFDSPKGDDNNESLSSRSALGNERVWSEKWTLGLSRLIQRGWERATRDVRAILRPLESMPKEMSVGIFELEQAYGCPP
jgi:hypothetical protein